MHKRIRAIFAASVFFCLSALYAEVAATVAPRPGADAAQESGGIASWYGAGFHGRPTSNGEVYDKEKLTCAHRSYPFGTYLLVRNLDNGSSVVVRVNDRGPFAKNRIIDLSEAAARIIGMIPTGTARVSLAVIPPEEALAWKGGTPNGAPLAPLTASPSVASKGSVPLDAAAHDSNDGAIVRIQVASYASETNARGTVDRLAASGLTASIECASGRFRVVFPSLAPTEARLVALRLDGLGYRGYVVTTVRPD
jgi:rare lipoprotein A